MRNTMRLVIGGVAAVWAMGLPTASAAATEPAASKTDDIPDLDFRRYRLDNGLEVILHRDTRVPLVAVDVWYHVGSGNETPGKSGFAHLFEHMMFQGAKHIGEDVHFDVLREIGASSINGSTNPDRTNYFEVVPSNHLETALWLESDRMGYLLDVLNQTSLQNQIDVVRNERRQRYDNVPYGKDRFAVAEALYPEGHPYRYLTIGRHEDLENASLEDVRGFFKKWYVPSNATLTVAGDIEIDQAKKVIDKWFGSFPTIAEPKQPEVTTPPLRKIVRKQFDDSFARLPRVHYVWISPENLAPGDVELDILASVLGADGWGRLYKRLVVEEQLAQRVAVYQHGMNFSGEFHVVVDVKLGEDPAEVEKVVQTELQRVMDEPIEPAELRRAVNGLEADFVWGLESLLSRAERLQYFNHYADDPGFTDAYLRRYRSRTSEHVLEVAEKVLSRPRAELLTRPGEGGAVASSKGAKGVKGGAR